jgi:hypothetical protein
MRHRPVSKVLGKAFAVIPFSWSSPGSNGTLQSFPQHRLELLVTGHAMQQSSRQTYLKGKIISIPKFV